MRDLEIRGAGNLLGPQQSGHIATVGYEFYCGLLEKAVRQLKKLPPKLAVDVELDLPIDAYLPHDYVTDIRARIDFYRRLSKICEFGEISEIENELKDRFGHLPLCVTQLLELSEIRLEAHCGKLPPSLMTMAFYAFDIPMPRESNNSLVIQQSTCESLTRTLPTSRYPKRLRGVP